MSKHLSLFFALILTVAFPLTLSGCSTSKPLEQGVVSFSDTTPTQQQTLSTTTTTQVASTTQKSTTTSKSTSVTISKSTTTTTKALVQNSTTSPVIYQPTSKPTSTSVTTRSTKATTRATTQTTTAPTKPYYVSHEKVSHTRPNSFDVNGAPVLNCIYGTENVAQAGDTLVYKITMSDGGSSGISVTGQMGCSVTQNGNLIIVVPDGSFDSMLVRITVTDQGGRNKVIGITNAVWVRTSALRNNTQELLTYYAKRTGMTVCESITDLGIVNLSRFPIVKNKYAGMAWFADAISALDQLKASGKNHVMIIDQTDMCSIVGR